MSLPDLHSAPSDCYTPDISVAFNRANKTVTIRDNGCGMSERVVLDHFLTVGNSRTSEKAYISEDYASIARFGIGFWSVFTVAERAKIETAPLVLAVPFSIALFNKGTFLRRLNEIVVVINRSKCSS